MIKDIKYTGYTTTPSDYECADGQLSTAINVVQEDGALRPIHKPAKMLLLDPTYKLLLIHNTSSGDKNYILCDKETHTKLYWLATSDKTSDPTLIATLDSALTDLAIIGNTLFLSIVDGDKSRLEYILWRGTYYDYLGQQPKCPTIQFALTDESTHDSTGSDESTIVVDDDDVGVCRRLYSLFNSGNSNGASSTHPSTSYEFSDSLRSSISNALWGHLLNYVADYCTEKNRFYQPFFIRYAFRMSDGSYTKYSAPILMTPNSGIPFTVADVIYNESTQQLTLKSTFDMAICKLWYQITDYDKEKLQQWKDVITHVTIFISAPIYTYNQGKNFEKAYSSLTTTGLKAFSHSKYGNYSDVRNEENEVDMNSSILYWNYPTYEQKEYEDKLESTMLFYQVCEIEIEDILKGEGTDSLTELKMPESIQSSLTTRTVMKDDYQTNDSYAGKSLYVYNNRLNMSNITLALFNGYTLPQMTQYRDPHGETEFKITAYTYIKKNAKEYVVKNDFTLSLETFSDLTNNFPRYLFYPDSGAYKMLIQWNEGNGGIVCIEVPLKLHPTLTGAYYFRGMAVDAANPTVTMISNDSTTDIEKTVLSPNKLYSSEASNQFTFLATGINTIGSGSIIGIRAAVKALSQGQFGQHPLYAFCSDGVWALKLTDKGSYESIQVVTPDVCIDEKSITQIDSSVLFATARGIMEISGSTSVCLSDDIDNINTTQSDTDLPSMGVLTTLASIDSVDLEMIKFRKYIQDCGMIYDYINQRIIVYNPTQTYAYVYSIKSKTWSTMHSDIDYHINSYPDAIAVSREISYLITQYRGIHDLNADDNAEKYEVNPNTIAEGETPGVTTEPLTKVMDLSASDTSIMGAGMIVTRPIKLASNNLKSLRALVQRGMFVSEHVNQILYASNDLFNWFAVASSTDGMIQALGGTPYKYYKLAVVTKLLNGESLDGFSVDSLERFTNKLR
jgi:hypothetical protein